MIKSGKVYAKKKVAQKIYIINALKNFAVDYPYDKQNREVHFRLKYQRWLLYMFCKIF